MYHLRRRELFNAVKTKFKNWKQYQATVRELSALSSRELKDLGITRDEIQSIAKQHSMMNL